MIVDIVNSEVKNLEGPVIIDFYADWCQPCKNLHPILEKLSDKYEDITIGRCNIEDNDSLIDEYEVRNIPTLIFIKDGKYIERLTGFKNSDQIENKIKEIL